MIAVIQRVRNAAVSVSGNTIASIGNGAMALVGIEHSDTMTDAQRLARRIGELRFFDDPRGRLNLSLRDVNGALLVISQFTLCGDCSKGRRPSYIRAAPAEQARPLFDGLVDALRRDEYQVETGIFGAEMQVSLVNDGPVTLIMESARRDRSRA